MQPGWQWGIGTFGAAVLILPWSRVRCRWWSPIWRCGRLGPGSASAQQAIVSKLVPAARGTLLAFNTSALYVGGTIGPAVSGVLLARGGFPAAGSWSAFLAAAAVVLAWRALPGQPSA